MTKTKSPRRRRAKIDTARMLAVRASAPISPTFGARMGGPRRTCLSPAGWP